AVAAEIARRVHQPFAKVILPKPIHDDAGREWIPWVRDPLRQGKASTLVRREVCRCRREEADVRPFTIDSLRLLTSAAMGGGRVEFQWDDPQRPCVDLLALLHRIPAMQAIRRVRFDLECAA